MLCERAGNCLRRLEHCQTPCLKLSPHWTPLVPAWNVEGPGNDRAAAQRGPLVGWRVKRRQCVMLIEQCLKVVAGQAILVRGETGINKMPLVEESASPASSIPSIGTTTSEINLLIEL